MECEILLTLQQAALLEDKKYKTLKMQIIRGKLNAIKIETGTKCGFEYRVPLSALSELAQKKYFVEMSDANAELPKPKESKPRQTSMEFLTAKQREDAHYWEEVIREWQKYTEGKHKNKTEATKEFIEVYNQNNERKISMRTLYEKYKLFKEYGLAGLADGRKSHEKKGRRIDERLWSAFLQYYLDENKLSISYIYENLAEWVRLEGLDIKIPSETTIRRAAEDIPVPVLTYFREGGKAFDDKCLPYVVRRYDFLSNDFWSADYHTLDFMVRDDLTGEVYRPYLITWIDIRSRKILAMRMRKSADSHGVILAFKDAVVKHGLPDNVYLDNGREFLVSDFGGRGKRKTDVNAFYGTGILERLNIKMINAKVCNGKAKVIERSFKQVTSEFSKLFITYCGNRPGNRPERHKEVIKKLDNIPLASEVMADLETYLFGRYNQKESEAEGLNGISPNECYAENLLKKRVISEEQANLLLLRNEKLQTACRNGVYIKISGRKLWYFNEEFVSLHMGEKVFVRYDPDALGSVRIYDKNEVFFAVAERKLEGGYAGDNDLDAIKENSQAKRKMTNVVKEFLENQKDIMAVPELRDIVMAVARENLENDEMQYEAAVLEAHFYNEYKEAVGGGTVVDFDTMISNARKMKGESKDE